MPIDGTARPHPTLFPIYALFFLSGISGLVYQIVWVRQFAYVFGNSVYSAAVVTAIFMGGLGLGGWAAGSWADTRFRTRPTLPLRAYGYAEALIGLAALSTAVLLPNLGAISAAVSGYVQGPNGWHMLSVGASILRYSVPVLLLTPVTALMGATLTLLIRYVVANEVSTSGFRIGLLYGFNTAGAALGCLATDLLLVPAVGLFATQCAASLGNFVAALGAVRWAARLEQDREHAPGEPSGATQDLRVNASAPATSAAPISWSPALIGACCAVLLTGAVGMGMEIVWFRYLVSMLGAYREVFSLLLGTILIGMWLGAVLAGAVERRLGRPAALYAAAQGLFVISTLLPLSMLTRPGLLRWNNHVWDKVATGTEWLHSLTTLPILIIELLPIALVTAVPALMMGMAFPLANAVVQTEAASVGQRAGLLYAANTLGAVLGAIGAGFWLLPRFGTQAAVLIVLACSVLSLLPLFIAVPRPRSRGDQWLFSLSGLTAMAMLMGWLRLPADWLVKQSLPPAGAPGEVMIAASEGIGETIIITEAPGSIRLITNGHSMSSTAVGAQRYMRLFAHLPLLTLQNAKDVLVICYGVGNTLNATLKHPSVERVDLVDISEHVLHHSKYFSAINGFPLTDPRVSVFVNDGRQHLRMASEGAYDLITAEPPPISHAGVAALYSSEFYQLVRSRLKPGGVMTHWLPIGQVGGTTGRSAVRAFLDVFPEAVLLSGDNRDLILVGVNGPEPFQLNPSRIEAALAANPGVARDLSRVGAASLVELAGLFVASPHSLAAATRDVLPVTDDYPALEYHAGRPHFGREPIAAELLRPLDDFDRWCPSCLDPAFASKLAGLPIYMSLLSQFYASDAFRSRKGDAKVIAGAGAERVVRGSAYLQRLLTQQDATPSE